MKNLLTFAVASAVFALAACGSRGSPGGKDASGQIQKATSQGGLPTSVTYAQIYATADGETHLRDVTLPLTATVTSPPAQAVGVSEEQLATTTRFAAFQPHWGDYDRDNNILHTPSSRRFVKVIQGNVWVRTSTGEARRFQRGDVFEVLDTAPSKGHTTWVGEEPAMALFFNHP